MDARRRKQLLYGGILLAIFILLVVAFYFVFVKPEASCSDGIQNQNEEGVDCGGSCGNVCLQNALPLKLIGKVNLLYVGLERASLLAKVENPNSALAARSFDYKFDVYDEAGNFLTSASGKSFIYAREFKYILVPNLAYPVDRISRVDFTSSNPAWTSASDFVRPAVTVQDYETQTFGKEFRVSGRAVNQDLISIPEVRVIAVFFGKFGQTSAASETKLKNLKVDEVRPFTVIYPFTEGVDTEATQVFAYAYRP
jgi:hypothetical protein